MKKTHIRDYATAAFRFYALHGDSEKYKAEVWENAVLEEHKVEGRSGISKPTEAAIIRAEKAIKNAAAAILDLDAVERTIEQLERMSGGNQIVKVLRMVYMANPQQDLRKNDITDRVHAAEIDIPASEGSIYRWLRITRELFAKERGLRL